MGSPTGHSQMMAIMELKFPMLKHSRATSMKNSSMRVRCFFFTTCGSQQPQRGPHKGHGLYHPPLRASGWSFPRAHIAVRPGAGGGGGAAEAGNTAIACGMQGRGQEGGERTERSRMSSQTVLGTECPP